MEHRKSWGRPLPDWWRKKLSDAHQARKARLGYINSPAARAKLSASKRGVPRSLALREKMRGANSIFWRGGVAKSNRLLRERAEYKEWRKAVFERDDYTCQHCGQRGGKLNADHTIPFALLPEKPEPSYGFHRYDVGLGQTLCEKCHRKTATYGFGTVRLRDQLIKVYSVR